MGFVPFSLIYFFIFFFFLSVAVHILFPCTYAVGALNSVCVFFVSSLSLVVFLRQCICLEVSCFELKKIWLYVMEPLSLLKA